MALKSVFFLNPSCIFLHVPRAHTLKRWADEEEEPYTEASSWKHMGKTQRGHSERTSRQTDPCTYFGRKIRRLAGVNWPTESFI